MEKENINSIDLDPKVEFKLSYKYRVMPWVVLCGTCLLLIVYLLLFFGVRPD